MGDAVAVDHAARECPTGHPPHEPRESADGIGGDVSTGACRAELAEDAWIAANVARLIGSGRLGEHRVEHQRFDVARVGCAYSSATFVP